MDFIDALRELLNFPYGWLVIVIIGIIVLLIVFSFVSSAVRRVSRLAEHTRARTCRHPLTSVETAVVTSNALII